MHSSDATLIVGTGRVASTLAGALYAADWPVAAIASRRAESAASLATDLGGRVGAGTLETLGGPFPVVLLAVVDGAVRPQAERLAELGMVNEHSVVLHLSGVHSSEVLEAAAAVGASTGSMHPLQTFPDRESGARHLPGSHWFVEGAERARDVAARMVSRLEGRLHVVDTGNKVLYHASASIACNLLTALMDAALDTAAAAGLQRDEMMQALYPLVRTALDNVRDHGTEASLTGPVSRADLETVRAHVQALRTVDDLLGIYRALGRRSVDIALAAGRVDAADAEALRRCLDE